MSTQYERPITRDLMKVATLAADAAHTTQDDEGIADTLALVVTAQGVLERCCESLQWQLVTQLDVATPLPEKTQKQGALGL